MRFDASPRFPRPVETRGRRGLALSAELISVLEAFERAGVPAVPFKGPTLSMLVHGDPVVRDFFDLDILVRRPDLTRARSLLADRGYHLALPLTPKQEAAHVAAAGELRLVRSDGCVLELHSAFGPVKFRAPVDADEVWGRLQPVRLGGGVVHTLGREDLLLFLTYHGAKHLWVRLEWLRDVAGLVRDGDGLDWQRVTRQARAHGAERMLRLAVVLAADVLKAPVPPAVLAAARADPAVVDLASRAQVWLFAQDGSAPGPWTRVKFFWRVRERLWDRVRDFALALVTPAPTDWEAVRLPGALSGLYYLVRPLRLAGKYARLMTRAVVARLLRS